MSNVYDFTGDKSIKQGSDRTVKLTIKSNGVTPDNLTGFKARMMLRHNVRSNVVFDTLTTENGRIVITPLTGVVELLFPNSVSSNYNFNFCSYDLELISGSSPEVVTRILQGVIENDLEVTR